MPTPRKPRREQFHEVPWVLKQEGLHPTLMSDRSLVLQSDDGPIRKVTISLTFPAGNRRMWHYRYIMRHFDQGAQILEYFSGPHGDPNQDTQVEAWVEEDGA